MTSNWNSLSLISVVDNKLSTSKPEILLGFPLAHYYWNMEIYKPLVLVVCKRFDITRFYNADNYTYKESKQKYWYNVYFLTYQEYRFENII